MFSDNKWTYPERSGNSISGHILEEEKEEEDGKAIYLRFKSVFAGLSYSNNKTAKNG